MFSNILRADAFRLRRSKAIYILILILMLYVTLAYASERVVLSFIESNMLDEQLGCNDASLFESAIAIVNSLLVSCVFFIIIFLDDFKNKGINAIVVSGVSKKIYYFEKLILYLGFLLMSFFAIVITLSVLQFSFGTTQFHIDLDTVFYATRMIVGQLLYGATIFSFYSVIGIALRKTSFFLLFILPFSMIWPLIADLVSWLASKITAMQVELHDYIFLNQLSALSSRSASTSEFFLGFVVCVITAFCFMLFSILLLETKDLP